MLEPGGFPLRWRTRTAEGSAGAPERVRESPVVAKEGNLDLAFHPGLAVESVLVRAWFADHLAALRASPAAAAGPAPGGAGDRKSTRLNSSHVKISYAVFCLKKKKPHRASWRR